MRRRGRERGLRREGCGGSIRVAGRWHYCVGHVRPRYKIAAGSSILRETHHSHHYCAHGYVWPSRAHTQPKKGGA